MPRSLRIFLVLTLCLQLVGLPAAVPVSAATHLAPSDPDPSGAIQAGLQSFAGVLSQFADLEQLGQAIPLTALNPSGDGALRLGSIFNESLYTGLGALPVNHTLDDLRNAILGLSGVYSGVSVTFSNVVVERDAGLYNVSFDVAANRTVTIPLAYTGDGVSLTGGSVQANLSLGGQLAFQLNTADTAPALYLLGEPTLAAAVTAAATVPAFNTQFGFTTATVTGTVGLNVAVDATFHDPDGDGFITADEWAHTALVDLVTGEFRDPSSGNAVDATFGLDADLIPGAPDATVTITDGSLRTGGFDPVVTPHLGDLGNFANVTADDVLAGFGQFTAALFGSQTAQDFKFPFLQQRMSDVVKFVQPMIDFTKQQGDAAIVCGTQGGNPPRGQPAYRDGETIYCQAFALDAATAVAWTLDGNPVAGGTLTTTVGLNPTSWITATLGATGATNLKVAYTDTSTDPSTNQHTVFLRFTSAQDMFDRLVQLGGFDPIRSQVQYSPTLQSLAYRLVKTVNPAAQDAGLDFGDALKQGSNLTGLSATGGASASVDIGDVALDVTFGVLLASVPISVTDRFFILAPGGPVFRADASASATVTLKGQIGFLEVSAVGDASKTGAAFELARQDPNQPMVSVNLLGSDLVISPTLTLSQAISVTGMLADIPRYVDVSCHAAFRGGLNVSASLGGMASASGKVGISWPDVFDDSCVPDLASLQVDTAGDFDTQLKLFDIAPSLYGTSTITDSLKILQDTASAEFTTAGRDLIGATLKNLATGAQCVITQVNSAHEVTCDSGLEGGVRLVGEPAVNKGNEWWTGDRYEINGDPLAMLGVVLDNLDLLATGLSNLGLAEMSANLPLVGFSPQDMITQFRDVKRAVDEIRNSTPEALITCGTAAGNPPVGDYRSAPKDSRIYCQAITPEAAAAVQWGISGGTVAANGAVTTTVGITPTVNAEFLLDQYGPGLQVTLAFTDTRGAHTTGLPSLSPPPSIQKLETLIESKLGLPAEALELEIADVAKAGGGTAKSLVTRLGYGICTQDPDGNTAIGDCPTSARQVAPVGIPVSIDLAKYDMPGIVGLDSTELKLEYSAHAQFDMAISLELLPTISILGSSGVSLTAGFAGENFNLHTNVGPLTVSVGAGARIEGTATNAVTSTTTLTAAATDFLAAGIQAGDLVFNTNPAKNNVFCEVSAAPAQHELTCDGLPDAKYWEAGDTFRIGGVGAMRLGAQFTLQREGSTPSSAYTITDFVGNISADLGGISKPDSVCEGDACTRLSLGASIGSVQKYFGDITCTTHFTDTANATCAGFDRLQAQLENASLDWVLLLQALPELLRYVEEKLDGAASGTSIPFIGESLDAGANVAGGLATVVDTVNDAVHLDQLASLQYAGQITSTLKSAIEPALEEIGLLLSDVTVTAYCEGSGSPPSLIACQPMSSTFGVADLRVTFTIGKEVTTTLPFNIGIPGVPIRTQGAIEPEVEWHFLVDFGLSRKIGPYIVAHDRNTGSLHPEDEPELGVSATVGIGAAADPSRCAEIDPFTAEEKAPFDVGFDPPPADPLAYSPNRCIVGTLGFLQVTLRDRGDEVTNTQMDQRSALSLGAGLDLTSSSDEDIGRIGFQELVGGVAGINFQVTADAHVDLRIRAGVRGVPGLPSVVTTFNLEWGREFVVGTQTETTLTGRDLTIEFENIYLDAGGFTRDFLAPITRDIKKITSPFMPVIDTIRAPLPVLSDLSRLVGGSDISLMSLLKAASGSDLTMIERVIDLIVFINSIPEPGPGPVWIPLGGDGPGSMILDAQRARDGPPTPGVEEDLIQSASEITSDELRDALKEAKDGNERSVVSETTFTRGGLTFPFLQQPAQIFSLLLGKDIVLVHYDFGTMRATAGVSYTFRFAIGPVPMSVTLAGSVTIEGRFAMGYDTYGLRQVLNGASLGKLLDGIYIDDFDASGKDVPEVSLIGTISARAAVDLVIVSAGVGGGIQLTLMLDLDDRPDNDGKLRINEIVNRLTNPWCLFTVAGKLEAFLEAFVKIDFFFFTKEWTFELARVTLLEFSAACDPPAPKLFTLEDRRDGPGIDTLVLNIGPRAGGRGILTDEKDEKISVRQLNTAGTKFSVSGFGIQQEATLVEPANVVADGGDGADEIAMLAGMDDSTATPITVTFTVATFLDGGPGNDQIRGGDGVDTIHGDGGEVSGAAGSDKILAGGGNDIVYGDGGNDAIDGGFGADTLRGGDNDDRIDGGPGSDHIYGEAADDTLSGGLGSDTDYLYGAAGGDTLSGGDGDDWLYGDEVLACGDPGSTDADTGYGRDLLDGGAGVDQLFGGNESDELIGGSGDDIVCGNGGDDRLDGDSDQLQTTFGSDTVSGGPGHDALWGRGGNDLLLGGAGSDILLGGAGRDRLLGEADNDLVAGDDAAVNPLDPVPDWTDLEGMLAIAARVTAGNAASAGDPIPMPDPAACDADPGHAVIGNGNSDCVSGGGGKDFLFGEGGDDFLFGDGDDDYMEGNAGRDLMHGNIGNDFMRGLSGDDITYGDEGDDTLYGDSGDDLMYGGPGDDVMRGGIGQDDMIGGSPGPGRDDGDDTMYGDADHDVMVGDNGRIVRDNPPVIDPANGAVVRHVTLLNLDAGNSDSTTRAGRDILYGNEGDDRLFGGGKADILRGGNGDDYLEGNNNDALDVQGQPGGDKLYGDAGQDDLVGGTSQSGQSDGADTLYGGDGTGGVTAGDFDVILGDNGNITRPESGGNWQVNTFNDAVVRAIVLFDVAVVGAPAPANTSGDDRLYGEASDDVMYGQGGEDEMHGGDGDDFVAGNAGADTLFGDAGNDDMVGGTGRINADPPTGTSGRLDGGDALHGGDGFDVMAGDNAIITRTLVDGHWIANTYNAGVQRQRIRLLDLDSPDVAQISGGDVMFGDAADDVMYGQGGGDTMRGGAGHDTMEGNTGNDTLYGDAGQDDLIGGTGRVNDDPPEGTANRLDGDDTLYGESDTADGATSGDAADVLLGDNGIITRVLDADGRWQSNSFNDAFARIVRLLDVATVSYGPAAGVSGSDHLWGNSDDDILYGQGGNDTLHGGAGHDTMEGNAGDDALWGGPGQDDMLGGTGPTLSNDPTTAVNGRLDGADRLRGESDELAGDADGGFSADAMLGDNGLITRPLMPDGSWAVNTFNGAYTRVAALLDVATLTYAVDPTVYGGDHLWGNSGDDIIYGQDGDDFAYGGAGDDYIEGNAGADWLEGNAGGDDIIGGTGRTTSNDPATCVDGRLDGADQMSGESGEGEGLADGNPPGSDGDVMLGDNGMVVRPLSAKGQWILNLFNGTIYRVTTLKDVETLPSMAVDSRVYGNDRMFGNSDDDILYGQGGDDLMCGGAGDDIMEGNAGSEVMYGGAGDDDMLGGTGRIVGDNPGSLLPGRVDASTKTRVVPLGATMQSVPLGDTMYGGDGSDVMLGDNGLITRRVDGDGHWITLVYLLFRDTDGSSLPRHVASTLARQRVDRVVQTIDAKNAQGKVAGSDLMYGGAGEDDMYGQFDDTGRTDGPAIGDEMYGEGGEDALLGDQGAVVNSVVSAATQLIRPNPPFIEDEVYVQGTLFRHVTLEQITLGGNDRMSGGPDGDWMHGGAGDDLMNGNGGDDRLFGDDGRDALWGGPGHDHLFGGNGGDWLDVKPRPEGRFGKGSEKRTFFPADPLEWFAFGEPDNFQGVDYIYGGWDQDAMQADVADMGPVIGDRLIDWMGAYNVYYVCPALYGEWVITRGNSPSMIAFLQGLATGDGTVDTATSGASGFNEVAMVFPNEAAQNSYPPHADNPGHFICSTSFGLSPSGMNWRDGYWVPWQAWLPIITINDAPMGARQ